MHVRKLLPALAAALVVAAPARADINVGVTLSATGPAASLGIPEKNTFELLPTTIGGAEGQLDRPRRRLRHDEGGDQHQEAHLRGQGRRDRRLDDHAELAGDDRRRRRRGDADDLDGRVGADRRSRRIPKTRWVFKTPQNDALMADAIAVHMKANGVKTMAYIGFADAYGDGWLAEMRSSAQTAGIKIVAEEKYNRNDASVTGQVLKLVAANPDAILIGAAGTPGATPQKELVARNYKGKIYQTHGVANPDFLRVVGKDGNGTLLPIGPMLVFEQLPDSNPIKKTAAEYITKYEAKYGKDRARRSAATRGTRTCCSRRRFPRR